MNSFVDLTLDVSAVPANPAGAGRYILELARELSRREDVLPTFIARKQDEQRWESLPGYSRVSAIVPKFRPFRLAWEQLFLPRELDAIAPRLHHGPHYTLPERAHFPLVVTVHDMTFFDHPEWHERKKVPIFKRAIQVAAEKATSIICVSQETADRLQDRFGSLPVTVIPHGVDHERFRPCASWDEEESDRLLLDHYGVQGRFIAFVGTVEPRKNVSSLVRAFDKIASSSAHSDIKLVIAGRTGWGTTEVDQAIAQSPYSERIIRLGFVSDNTVPALLRSAAVVVYPSLVEGFGLPALEALACGAPLVTTKRSAMEEVVGDSAVLVNSAVVDELAQSIESLLEDSSEAKRLREIGPKTAAAYTWEETANKHIAVYREIESPSRNGVQD